MLLFLVHQMYILFCNYHGRNLALAKSALANYFNIRDLSRKRILSLKKATLLRYTNLTFCDKRIADFYKNES